MKTTPSTVCQVHAHFSTASVAQRISVLLQVTMGYVSPQAFTFCDNIGLIQNSENIPIIYHWRRNKADERIALTLSDPLVDRTSFKFSMTIPKRDYMDFYRLDFKKYWWLPRDSDIMNDLKTRRLWHLRESASNNCSLRP